MKTLIAILLSLPTLSWADDVQSIPLQNLIYLSDVIMIGRVTEYKQSFKTYEGEATLTKMGVTNTQPNCLKGDCPPEITVSWGSVMGGSKIYPTAFDWILFLKYQPDGQLGATIPHIRGFLPVYYYSKFNPQTLMHEEQDTVIPAVYFENISDNQLLRQITRTVPMSSSLDYNEKHPVKVISVKAMIEKMKSI